MVAHHEVEPPPVKFVYFKRSANNHDFLIGLGRNPIKSTSFSSLLPPAPILRPGQDHFIWIFVFISIQISAHLTNNLIGIFIHNTNSCSRALVLNVGVFYQSVTCILPSSASSQQRKAKAKT